MKAKILEEEECGNKVILHSNGNNNKNNNNNVAIKDHVMKKKKKKRNKDEDEAPHVMMIKYKECRKNHAAKMGKYAVDGCCEFMAAGEEGSEGALRCAACDCHRNFHRSEITITIHSNSSSSNST